MFETDERIRYSEVDCNGIVTLDSIVNYFQDCTMLHTETVGMGIGQIMKTGNFWFLSAWQIEILRAPVLYEKVKVWTNPYETKGFFGNRNFQMLSESGEQLIRANSVWVHLNVETKTPTRITDEEKAAYNSEDVKLEMEYAPRKIKLYDDMEECAVLPVRLSQIDTNHHVNNCEYIRTAMEATGFTGLPKQLRAEYKKSAVMGDAFHVYLHKEEKLWTADLRGDEGESFATVEFLIG